MSESISQAPAPEIAATGLPVGSAVAAAPPKRNEFIHYGLRNPKLIFGLTVEVLLVLAAIIAPFFAKYAPLTTTNMAVQHPGGTFWLGTDLNGCRHVLAAHQRPAGVLPDPARSVRRSPRSSAWWSASS